MIKKVIVIIFLLFIFYFVYLFLKIYPVDEDYIITGHYNDIDNRCCKDLILINKEDAWGADHYQCISYNDYRWYKIKNSIW